MTYLAGVLDSSSHIGIKCVHGSAYSPIVIIARKDDGIIQAFLDEFGGYRAKHKNAAVIGGRKAFDMIYRLEPYIQAKKEHVRIILELAESFDRYMERGRPGLMIGAKERKIRENLYKQIRKLNEWNHRGNHKPKVMEQEPAESIQNLLDT